MIEFFIFYFFRSIRIMWNRLLITKQSHRLPLSVFRRFQSANQYYPINDDMYGLTDDQKQVREREN